MDSVISYIANQLEGGIVLYIVLEIVVFLIALWILYSVIKAAVKNAIFESRKELNYTIRKALLESKADIEAGIKEIPEYLLISIEDNTLKRQEQEEKAEWEYGKKMQRGQTEKPKQ